VVLLSIVIAAVWRRRRKTHGAETVGLPAQLPSGADGSETTAVQAIGPRSVEDLETRLAERDALQQKMESQALTSLKLAPVITKTAEIMAKHLRDKIAKEPEVSAQILRTWIHEEEA
jgi:flagellar biosynthesis/type III secretory pathway M-ring protein FliF/YscJ